MKMTEVRQRMTEIMRMQRLSPMTIKAYLSWVEQFAAFVWLFPAAGPCKDPKWGGCLYHVHNTAVQKRVRRAVFAARIHKKAGCHTFRHSFATHWLENADGNHEIALNRLQELLGHKDVKTTMVYLHLLPKLENITSPLDARPERIAA